LHPSFAAAIGARVQHLPKLVAFGAGLLSAVGFAPFELWPVTLICLGALIMLIADAPTMGSAALRGWLFGVGHFTIGMNWIAGAFRYQDAMPVWLGSVAVFVLALYLAVYPAIAAILAWRLAPGRARFSVPFMLIFAGAWTITEYLRATMFTGFAWNPIAVIFVPTPVDGVARWIGTYGLSGVAVLATGLCVLAIRDRRTIAPALAFAALLPLLGWVTTRDDPGLTAKRIRVVQPNTGVVQHNDPDHDEESVRALERQTGLTGGSPRLVLWPEGAAPYFLEEERWARERLASLLGPGDILLTGANALVFDRNGKVTAARNSLFALTPDARIAARYDKAHLVPYGEYLPMRPLLSAIGLSRLVPGDLDFLPGPGPTTLPLAGFGKVGIQICYEIVFSGQVIDRRNRPEFLFNPSTDAWFGTWGPPQHLAQARLRAIEEGVPVVRSTPTGISAVIDARGALVHALAYEKPGFIDARLPAAAPPTLFARTGNIMPLALAILLCAAGVALGRRRR